MRTRLVISTIPARWLRRRRSKCRSNRSACRAAAELSAWSRRKSPPLAARGRRVLFWPESRPAPSQLAGVGRLDSEPRRAHPMATTGGGTRTGKPLPCRGGASSHGVDGTPHRRAFRPRHRAAPPHGPAPPPHHEAAAPHHEAAAPDAGAWPPRDGATSPKREKPPFHEEKAPLRRDRPLSGVGAPRSCVEAPPPHREEAPPHVEEPPPRRERAVWR